MKYCLKGVGWQKIVTTRRETDLIIGTAKKTRKPAKHMYAEVCIVDRVLKHNMYLVAANDRDLKKRTRKVPGVLIISCAGVKYVVERLPDAPKK
jgi:rRNA-processing protein FCF1